MAIRAAILALAIVATCPLIRHRPAVPSIHLSAAAAAQAFQQGAEAAQLGLAIDACPFAGDDAARAWRAGWRWFHGSISE